jgi:hypothetical protein
MREGMRLALCAEGLQVVEFQNAPLPEHALFSGKFGYGRNCPWHCNPGGRPEYRIHDFPGALTAIRRSLVIGAPSQAVLCSPDLVDAYLVGFAKLAARFDEFMAFARSLPEDNPPWAKPPRLF